MAYHDYDGFVSNSMRKVFRSSPMLYEWQYILGNRPDPTPQMVLGQLMHAMLAGDASEFRVAPLIDRRTKEGKAQWAEFVETSKGAIVVPADLADQAIAMADAIRNHGTTRRLLDADGLVEQEFRTRAYGLPMKCKPDKIVRGLAIDWKTTSDPSPDGFTRSIVNYQYHQQAAWYIDVCKANGVEITHWLLVAVGSQPPHEVCAYYLPRVAIARGRDKNTQDIAGMKECYATGVWRAPRHYDIEELDIPAWAYRGA